jgi:hypothetical protein
MSTLADRLLEAIPDLGDELPPEPPAPPGPRRRDGYLVDLAVEFGLDKVLVWDVDNALARWAIETLRDGGDWSHEVYPVLGPSYVATNCTDDGVAGEADARADDAQYWIDLDDPATFNDALADQY